MIFNQEDLIFLRQGIISLNLELDDVKLNNLLIYLSFLVKWNKVFNLTAINEKRQMIIKHLFDCLAILPILDNISPNCILDVGSGGGIPGIILGITRPNWHIILNDSIAKKTSFLLQIKSLISLKNIEIINVRVEYIKKIFLPDIIISRAFTKLNNFYHLTQNLFGPKTCLVAMKGILHQDEINQLTVKGLDVKIYKILVPKLYAQRHLIIAKH